MNIRFKTFIIILISSLSIALLMLFSVRILLLKNLLNHEDEMLNQGSQAVIAMLNSEKSSMKSTVLDWSIWDDTYKFMQGMDEGYINDNLQDSTLVQLRLNTMIFVNKQGKIIYAKSYDLEHNQAISLDPEITDYIRQNNYYLSHLSINEPHSGIMSIGNKHMLLAISAVTTSDQKSPPDGYLIIGRYLERNFIKYMETVTRQNISITELTVPPGSQMQNEGDNQIQDFRTPMIKKDKDTATEFSVIQDINNQPDIKLTVTMKRDAFNRGSRDLDMAILIFLIGLLIIGATCIVALDETVIKRLNILHDFVREVGSKKNIRSRIKLPGKDEISRLASSTNWMLQEIELAYKDIQKADERFRLTMEATNDGFWDLNLENMKFYISYEWLSYVGDTRLGEKELYEKYLGAFNENGLNLQGIINSCLRGDREYLSEEYWVFKSSGEQLWILNRGKVVEHDENGKPKRMVGTFSDITKKKEIEQELYRLSYTDKLTGLKNRAFMEKVLDEMDMSGEESRYTIVMGDINGLKYTNDTLGHQEGDKRLCKMADILRECCSYDDVIARWGGDEFLILLKNKDDVYCEDLIKKIKNKCEETTDLLVKLSIALGKADKNNTSDNMDEIIRQAEEKMYRNKLLESRSMRNATLISLERTLFEKSRETEEHAVRMKNMCLKIGEAMGFSQDELDELALLAMLHDIGKVAIPDQILLKPGKLTEEEWEVMKTHPQVGYRIAMSSPELSHIANDIRTHHERYDGKGYPLGLKGREISKMSRILAIVDSYDVMTHERPYKEAISQEEAIEELIKCSGKQFDPEIVKLFLKIFEKSSSEMILQ